MRLKLHNAWTCICAINDCHAVAVGVFRDQEDAQREANVNCDSAHFIARTIDTSKMAEGSAESCLYGHWIRHGIENHPMSSPQYDLRDFLFLKGVRFTILTPMSAREEEGAICSEIGLTYLK